MYKYVLKFHPDMVFFNEKSSCTVKCSLWFDDENFLRHIPDQPSLRESLIGKLQQCRDLLCPAEVCSALLQYCASSFECVRAKVTVGSETGEKVSQESTYTTIYLSLGSNVGDKAASLKTALQYLRESKALFIDRVSSTVETDPIECTHRDIFYNMAVKARTGLTVEQLLSYVKTIEQQMGRTWTKRNYPRPIDIDILYYGSVCVHTAQLTIPHPQVYDRPYVSALLAEINPSFTDPVTMNPLAVGTSAFRRIVERCI